MEADVAGYITINGIEGSLYISESAFKYIDHIDIDTIGNIPLEEDNDDWRM